MAGRTLLSASILDADLSDLAREVRRAEKAGADRIHLDVMDGHFVPNLTFGARTIKSLRRVTRLPFDAHLMIAEPGRYIEQYIDAGCDTITFHVEVVEPIEPTLEAIRAAGRSPGLAIKPATDLSAVEPYHQLLDVVMIMTVEPGFGGQSFMTEPARKALGARKLFERAGRAGALHVDGGVKRDTAEYVGELGFDVLVVGSALWTKGHDMANEVRTIKSLADRGFASTHTPGASEVPRDDWVTFASLPLDLGDGLAAELEAGGIPVMRLPAGANQEVSRFDLLIPAASEQAAVRRCGASRDRALAALEADDRGTAGERQVSRSRVS